MMNIVVLIVAFCLLLCVIMLGVVMLNVIMLSVVVPFHKHFFSHN
jgi:hypothetical protein